jgi:non-ribosomal peptide synthetase component F
VVKEAIAHSDLPFDRVVDALQPPRDPSRTPLFQVNFRGPRKPLPSLELTGIDATPAKYIDNGTSKFELSLEIESSVGSGCYFEYCSDLFEDRTITQMEEDVRQLLAGLIAEPAVPLSQVAAVQAIKRRRQA